MTNLVQIHAALRQNTMPQRQTLAAARRHTVSWVAYLQGIVHKSIGFARAHRLAGYAAPSGRTLATGGWGCILTTFACTASAFDLPSGQSLEFQESFYERQESGALWARFRFIMPAIGQGVTYGEVADDFLTLCETYVLPALEGQDIPDQIVISFADRATQFGIATPEATQYFEAFRPNGTSCIWEGF